MEIVDVLSSKRLRLDGNVKPLKYILELQPDIENMKTAGKVEIELQVFEQTNVITIHCGKTISIINIKLHWNKSVQVVKVEKIVLEDILIFHLSETILCGKTELTIEFEGKIEENMTGLYLTKYKDKNENLHKCLITQFEAAYARNMFPCFDEPSFKAIFELKIVVDSKLKCLSNTELISLTHHDNGKSCHVFKCTPMMSTYLLALVVGNFDSLSTYSKSGIQVSVYTPINKYNYGLSALKIGCDIIEFYNKYFKINYPLSKLDMVAVPDFMFGAMENWGLVTYREDLLLIDSIKSSNRTIKNVHLVIAHELAHQWFGNLVTMEWWNDLWLNEGFANFIEFLCVDKIAPELKVWQTFFLSNLSPALELDSFKNSHPINVEIKSTVELDNIFDEITYCKGASIISMMYDFIGDKAFSEGISSYFSKFKYMNVCTNDLWDALERASAKPIPKIMSTFVEQTGYPIIEIIDVKNVDNGLEIRLKQQHFLLEPDNIVSKQLWCIPVTISLDGTNNNLYKFNFDTQNHTITIPCTSPPPFFVLNPLRIGYYRIWYPKDILQNIMKNVQLLKFQTCLGLLSDYYSFTQSGQISVTDYIDMLKYFQDYLNNEVWRFISRSLIDIYILILNFSDNEGYIAKFSEFCNSLVKPILSKVQFDREGPLDKSESTLKLICALLSILIYTDNDTVCELQKWFIDHTEGKKSVHPDFRLFIFAAGFKLPDSLDRIIKFSRTLTLTEEIVDILRAASGIKDEKTIIKVYELALSNEFRPQDSRIIFSSFGWSPHALKFKWNYLKLNYHRIVTYYSNPNINTRIVKDTISYIFNKSEYDEIVSFFSTVQNRPHEMTFERGLENIRINITWLANNQDSIKKWLKI